MTDIKTADRVVVSVTATESGDWQVVSTPVGFQGITSALFADDQYIHGFCRFENGEDFEVYDTDDDTTTHLLQITNVSGTVTIARPATCYDSSVNGGDRADAGAGTHTLTIALGAGTMKRILREVNVAYKTFTSGDATPSVANYRLFTTAGTTNITRFDDMEPGKVFYVRRGASDITIEHSSDIILSGGVNTTLTTSNAMIAFVEGGGVARQIGGSGGGSFAGVPATTVAALADVGNSINTSGKFKGKLVDDESDRTWKSLGALAASKWRPLDDMSGGSDITPA